MSSTRPRTGSAMACAVRAVRPSRLLVLAACLAVALSGAPAVADEATSPAAAAQARSYAIPGGSLAATLKRFAMQAGVTLAAPSALTQERTSAGLSGRYTVTEGLAELLRGHGLRAVADANGGYAVEAAAAGADASPATADAEGHPADGAGRVQPARRDHRGQRLVHARRHRHRHAHGADAAADAAVDQRHHAAGDGRLQPDHDRPGHAAHAGHQHRDLRQRAHRVLRARLRHPELPVRRHPDDARLGVLGRQHAQRHGDLRPHRGAQGRHRPAHRQRHARRDHQPDPQEAHARPLRPPAAGRRPLGHLSRRSRRRRPAQRERQHPRARRRRVRGPQLQPRSLFAPGVGVLTASSKRT